MEALSGSGTSPCKMYLSGKEENPTTIDVVDLNLLYTDCQVYRIKL